MTDPEHVLTPDKYALVPGVPSVLGMSTYVRGGVWIIYETTRYTPEPGTLTRSQQSPESLILLENQKLVGLPKAALALLRVPPGCEKNSAILKPGRTRRTCLGGQEAIAVGLKATLGAHCESGRIAPATTRGRSEHFRELSGFSPGSFSSGDSRPRKRLCIPGSPAWKL